MTRNPDIYLASGSPRRRILLEQIGLTYDTLTVTVDETPRSPEDPLAYVTRLALTKARAGWNTLGQRPARPVLGADTDVVLDGVILGKPEDRTAGLAMLAALSGREHQVFSAVALVDGERQALRIQENRVRFRTIDDAERHAYWNTGESADKAGGYAIQGRAAVFVAELKGSYSGVMGLPLFETAELLREFGISIF